MKNSGSLIAFLFVVLFSTCGISRVSMTRDNASVNFDKNQVVVAVIDTGFDMNSDWSDALKHEKEFRKPKLCKSGHKDFTGYGIDDRHSHGTHIAGLIAKYAKDADYCLVILKYYNTGKEKSDTLKLTGLAFERAIELKVDIINYSGGGNEKSEKECQLIKKALDAGITVVAAAGNNGDDVNKRPYYPAMCDNRVVMVGNVDSSNDFVSSSNYSGNGPGERFLYKEIGKAYSLIPDNDMGYMNGTSQATAIKTGKIVDSLKKH